MSAAASPSVLESLSNDLTRAVELVGASVVAIHARRRIPSSGIVWKDGIIVTASHKLQRDDDISVTLPNGEKVDGSIGGRDPSTDLAILRFKGPATAANIDSADSLRVGQLVLALGRPGPSVTAALG